MPNAIDIGSNSIRLALTDGRVLSHITKLADGLQKTGKLSPRGVESSIAALKEFVALAGGADNVFAFATEAVRKAEDGREFCDRVKKLTGSTVHVLDGESEARLALAGVTKPDGAVTVCDLGGGSLEVISSADGSTPDYIKSLPLGVVVMKNRYDGDYRSAIDELPELVNQFDPPRNRAAVITGGSACTLAAGMLDLKTYDKKAVSALFTCARLDDFLPMAMSKKLAVFRPVCSKRADTLPYGAIVIQALLNRLGVTEFYVSDAGNLEAIVSGKIPVSSLF